MFQLIFMIHFASTWFLIGLCWLVQRVQYPLMDRVGLAAFANYEAGHVSRIGPVVAPIMLIELATGVGLATMADDSLQRPAFLGGLGLIALIWISTFLIQVPLHNSLGRNFVRADHASLVRTNWIRTVAWSLRGVLLLWISIDLLDFARPAT